MGFILEYISNQYGAFVTFAQQNQVIAGALSLWGLTVLTFLLKTVPGRALEFSKKHLTTTLYVTTQHKVFYNLMNWFQNSSLSGKLRNIKLTNGQYGSDSSTTKGIGYGSHILWFKGRPMLVKLEKDEGGSLDKERETLSITKLGRNHKLFDNLMEKWDTSSENTDEIEVRGFDSKNRCWEWRQDQKKRPLDTIYIERDKKKKLLNTLHTFQEKEQWYVEHGIPYRLGILLHGSPGTGKTSLIRAIASYMNAKICTLSVDQLPFLLTAGAGLPKKAVLVIEDIDASAQTQERENFFDRGDEEDKDEKISFIKEFGELMSSGGGISEILNAIDGISDTHGRILIMTTNHPEKIDRALLRPGRIDLRLEIGFVTRESFCDFMEAFFPGTQVPLGKVKPRTTAADLQQKVLEGMTAQDIIDTYIEKGRICGTREIHGCPD